MTDISIKELNKAEVLAALYNGSHPQGLGFLHYNSKSMTASEAQGLLDKGTYFDYLQGRVMKIDLSGDSFDPGLYDRDNGQGSAQKIINALTSSHMVNPEEVEIQHLEGTRKAAKEAMDNLNTKTKFIGKGILELGLNDCADKLKPHLDEVLDDED